MYYLFSIISMCGQYYYAFDFWTLFNLANRSINYMEDVKSCLFSADKNYV